jgi:hypothetical protein
MRYRTRPRWWVAVGVAAVLFAGCQEQPDETPVPEQAAVDTVQAPPGTSPTAPPGHSTPQLSVHEAQGDERRLLLGRLLGMGRTYEEVRQQFPTAGPLQSEGATGVETAPALAESRVPIRLLGRRAVLELNFEENRLYSYYFVMDDLDCARADALYASLQDFYAEPYGTYREETDTESAQGPATSSYWSVGRLGLVVTSRQYGDTCRLAWGYQVEQP